MFLWRDILIDADVVVVVDVYFFIKNKHKKLKSKKLAFAIEKLFEIWQILIFCFAMNCHFEFLLGVHKMILNLRPVGQVMR